MPFDFSAVAARYAAYRPHYPPALADALAARCASRELAWEAGCGSGQLTASLADKFARVIATDPARAQLAHAPAHPRVEYRCEPAEASSLPDACADLAVAAQAAHWFDWPRYVAEVARVLRPGALAAVVTYGNVELAGEAGELVRRYYDELNPYWAPERRHVEDGYRQLAWPWPELPSPAIDLRERWTRDELAGYVATWSATSRMVAAVGAARYEQLCADLARLWPDGERGDVSWPVVVRAARCVPGAHRA